AIHRMVPEQYSEVIRSENVFRLLVEVASRLPKANVIAILSPDGHIVNHSPSWPAPNIDVSDREFFVAQKTGHPGIYVGLTVVGRVNPVPTLFFSRRVESQQGEFLGVVQVGLPISYFQRIYNSNGSLSDQKFLFLRSDGTVLAHYPD